MNAIEVLNASKVYRRYSRRHTMQFAQREAKHAALVAQDSTTIARCPPVRSATQPQAVGATMRL